MDIQRMVEPCKAVAWGWDVAREGGRVFRSHRFLTRAQ